MVINLTLEDLVAYTSWERQKWHQFFREHGEQVLKTSNGPHGDGRFETVGDLVRHIFGAEKRYVERLADRQLTDLASIPSDDVEALFRFGEQSRNGLQEFVRSFSGEKWDVPQELHFPNLKASATATPRKIVVHVVMHEIRHWAQIATLLRLNGIAGEFHDFLFCPVMDGEFAHRQQRDRRAEGWNRETEMRLETERLVVRNWQESDKECYMRLAKDVGFNCFSRPGHFLVSSVEEARQKISERMKLFKERKLGKFPVFMKDTGEFIGTCGIEPYQLGDCAEVELGYRLCLDYWGKGYAREAASVVLRYGFEELKLGRVLGLALPQNRASLKILETLGFKYRQDFLHAGLKHRLYEIRRNDLAS